MTQKIKTTLIPESGIELVPSHVMESSVETDFIRSLSHIIAQSTQGSVALRSTTDGRLLVAAAGTWYEYYDTENGNAPDAYDAPNTYEQTEAWYVTDIIIEAFAAEVSFRNAAGVWGGDKYLPVGAYSLELIHYGMRIRNHVALSVANYWFTIYR